MNRPVPGKRIHLIRWVPGDADGGWRSDVRMGRYLGDDGADWILEIDGRSERLPREVWQRFVPHSDQTPQVAARGAEVISIPTTSRPLMEPEFHPGE